MDAVTGVPTKFAGLPLGTRAIELPDDSANGSSFFLNVFGRPDNASACECERGNDGSLAQRLHLLNSKTIQEKLASPQGRATLLAKEKTAPVSEKLRSVYLAALSRTPTEEETKTAADFLAKRGSQEQPAWEDILWAVLNTKEFLFNH